MTRSIVPLLAGVLLGAVPTMAETSALAITVDEIGNPAPPRATAVCLALAPDGTPVLSWVEPQKENTGPVRVAAFHPPTKTWGPAHTITGGGAAANSVDGPKVVFDGRGRATAIWGDGHGGVFVSESLDGAATWSTPQPWTRDGHAVEKFSFTRLADGRVLAAWLDNRGKKGGMMKQQLYARVLAADGPDQLVDDSACDCCPTTLTPFPDGSALIAYRGRTDDEIRDIRVARFRDGSWEKPHPVNNDGWKINACPFNGPRLASDGGRVAIAWFTAAGNEPRVLASMSPDAGSRFVMPLTLNNGKAAGQVDTVLLHDSAFLVSYLEADGSLWLRRITPEYATTDPVSLSARREGKVSGIARMALLRDYDGGNANAVILTAFARGGANARIVTQLITVPEGALLVAEKNCACAPTPEQLRGYSMRGELLEIVRQTATARVRNLEVPGVFAAGARDFRVPRDEVAGLAPGRRFLGRVEQRRGDWWLYDIRLLAEPAAH